MAILRVFHMLTAYTCKPFEELDLEQLYQICKLRQAVFNVEQKIQCVDLDDLDQSSLHCWLEGDKNQMLAYARIVSPNEKYHDPSIGRILTVKQVRRTGLGKKLLELAIASAIKEFNCDAIRISAQRYLEDFYSNFGFSVVSEPYLAEGIEHIAMRKEVTNG